MEYEAVGNEKVCKRNIELHWLMPRFVPNQHRIAVFRKGNPLVLRKTFKLFVLFLKENDLVSGRTVAVDGTKMRALNSKKNNYSAKKIQLHLEYIEEQMQNYPETLDAIDKSKSPSKLHNISQKIE